MVQPLGSGGMGEVYRARDTRLGRDVALKLLPVHMQQDEEALARFQREAKIISGLSHPHILTIHEVGKARLKGSRRATHYMVMEFIDGRTLREVMAQESDGRKMLDYLAQVADALQKAHSAGIVHRDLKPENVMVTRDGYAKVLDFGLAKMVSTWVDETKDEADTARFQTQQGIVIGTIGYMSPEQVQGKAIDHRSDIFSFGCMVYEVLTGHRPFEADGIVDTLHLIMHATPAALPSSTGAGMQRIVNRCLAKEPAARFAAMRELAAALRDAAFDWDGRVRASSRKVRVQSSTSGTRMKSIAVMPFANLSNDPEMEYLSDGLTESIIHALSRVGKRLKVMARSTVFTYKSKEISPQQLGAELGVNAIVTGRVQRMGNTLTVGAELVSTRDGSQIWGDRFRKAFADIFEVHDTIAEHISEQLKIKLTSGEKRRLAQRPTRKSEAFELYLKGRFYWNKRTTEGLHRAIRMFEQAIDVDPDYALAYVGLADCYAILLGRFLAPPKECAVRIEESLARAIELDPMLAEAHAGLANFHTNYHWDWREADREFRQAIYHDPN
ncbi:MAG TPA: protein kinase, partial [Thermoanaerobaculia bacterium]|nr:protein kinase [Thermoanaerobaculia bacterium]